MPTQESFNPLAMESLAHSIVVRLTEMEAVALDDIPRVPGAGVYAIYYRGAFPAYHLLSIANRPSWGAPIYVGKAVPAGGRRGLGAPASTNALSGRLREHAASVRASANLDISDFAARWVVTDDIWIALGESALIRASQPLWNSLIDGFGNHDPGKGRHRGARSRWDTLHPGRPWAAKLEPREETAVDISRDAAEFLRARLN